MENTPPPTSAAARRRILFILEHYYPYVGGAESYFQQMAEGLAARGHHVRVLTLRLPGTPAREFHSAVEITRVRSTPLAARYFFSLLAIPAALRLASQADVIHTTTYNAALPAWIAQAISRRPAILTVHEVFGPQWNTLPGLNHYLGYGFRLFEWFVLRLPFTHYLCVSAFTRKRLLAYSRAPESRASVVYPAIDYEFWNRARHHPRDLRHELGLQPDVFIYLFFGRPGVSKGLEYLVEAAAHVQVSLPNSRLVMLLARQPADRYRAILECISVLGLAQHVVILDPVARADLPSYLLAADGIVIPSVSEGFGSSANEAAFLGCRVVATSGHAVEEVLGDSVTLVPSRHPRALAEAISSLSHAPVERPAPVRRNDIAAHLSAIEAVYDKLLGPDA